MTENRCVELKQIPIDKLERGEFQPRVHFDKKALEELAISIREQGLIEPLVVRTLGRNYEIIAGERRWRAAQLACLDKVPCLVHEYTDEQAMAVTLIENIQREDLNVIEEALGYQRLLDHFYDSHEKLASKVGKSRSHVTNCLRLLTLAKAVQDALSENRISMGQAKMLVGLTESQQKNLLTQIEKYDWSARKVEREVKKLKAEPKSYHSDRDVEKLEAVIAENFGAEAQIESTDLSGGWLKIKFFDNDTLAGLLDKMGVSYDDESIKS